MFCKNSSSAPISTSFYLKPADPENWAWENQPRFWLKRRPLEPYFKILPTLSSRKNCSEKLSCFEFYPVRPLRALYFHFSETGQFRTRNGRFRLFSPFFVLVRESTSTESHRELILQTHNVSNVPHKIKNRSKGSMQTKNKKPLT